MRFQKEYREFGPHPPPLENHKALGFLGNKSPDLLEYHRATKPVFNALMLGLLRSASETPFKWRFAGWLKMARFYRYLDPLFPLPSTARQ